MMATTVSHSVSGRAVVVAHHRGEFCAISAMANVANVYSSMLEGRCGICIQMTGKLWRHCVSVEPSLNPRHLSLEMAKPHLMPYGGPN